jgi:hypothetical protein
MQTKEEQLGHETTSTKQLPFLDDVIEDPLKRY